VVWMIAAGSSLIAGAALWTGGGVEAGGVEDACAALSSEPEIIRTSVYSRVRMKAPGGVFAIF
jgi:hypothetical protein